MAPITHGMPGYRRGCRCAPCRLAKSDSMRAYRARARERDRANEVAAVEHPKEEVDPSATPASIDFTIEPGPIQTALSENLKDLVGDPPWKQTLSGMAHLNARMLDQVNRHNRLDLVSALELRTMELLNRLRAVSDGAAGSVSAEAEAFLHDLGAPD